MREAARSLPKQRQLLTIMLVIYLLIMASSYWSMLRKSHLTTFTKSSEMSKVWLQYWSCECKVRDMNRLGDLCKGDFAILLLISEAESKEKWCMGPYAVVDYNLTLMVPKRENFSLSFFALSEPTHLGMWLWDWGKKSNFLSIDSWFWWFLVFCRILSVR